MKEDNDHVTEASAGPRADLRGYQRDEGISRFHGKVLLGDAFDLFDQLPEQSVDLIIALLGAQRIWPRA